MIWEEARVASGFLLLSRGLGLVFAGFFFCFSKLCIPRMYFKIVPAMKRFVGTSKKVHYSEFRLFASSPLTQSAFFWCVCSELLPKWSAQCATKNADFWIVSWSLHSNLCLGGKHIFPCREGQKNILQNTECICVHVREAQNCFLSIPAGIHSTDIQTTATCLFDEPRLLQSSIKQYCFYFVSFADSCFFDSFTLSCNSVVLFPTKYPQFVTGIIKTT